MQALRWAGDRTLVLKKTLMLMTCQDAKSGNIAEVHDYMQQC